MAVRIFPTSKFTVILTLLLVGWAHCLHGQTAADYPQTTYQALVQDAGTADSPEKQKQDEEIFELIKLLVVALDQIDRNYVKEVDRRELIDGAIQGMLGKLDRHSNYIPPSNVDSFKSRVENEFGGIGIRLRNDNG